jgi:hypothetical protein
LRERAARLGLRCHGGRLRSQWQAVGCERCAWMRAGGNGSREPVGVAGKSAVSGTCGREFDRYFVVVLSYLFTDYVWQG